MTVFNLRLPLPGNPTGSDRLPAYVQKALTHCLSLLIHNHIEAFFANSVDGFSFRCSYYAQEAIGIKYAIPLYLVCEQNN